MRSRRLTAVSWEQRAGNLNVADDKSDRGTGEVQVPALISTQPALRWLFSASDRSRQMSG